MKVMDVYWLPASACPLSWPHSMGCPSTERCQIAIRSAVITNSTSLHVAACYGTILCANTSTMNDT